MVRRSGRTGEGRCGGVKRTTEWWDCDNGLYGARIKKGVSEQTALTKLAAYEDTGLEPDEVKTALRAQQEREDPKPLTLKELKERVGKPVFVVNLDFPRSEWKIYKGLSRFDKTGSVLIFSREQYWRSQYGKTWLAYAHEPREATP